MLAQGRDRLGKTAYERHQPERTLLYQLVEAHYPALVDQLAQRGKSLPDHVHWEFEAYLKCGRLEHGFLRVRCDKCHCEQLVAFSCKKRGFCPSCGARRMAETAASFLQPFSAYIFQKTRTTIPLNTIATYDWATEEW